jgi:hypothetical protein
MKIANRSRLLVTLVVAAATAAVAASLLASSRDAYASALTVAGAKRSFVGIPNAGETTTCAECHVKPVPAGAGSIALTFEPALGANNTYALKTPYTVTVTLTDNEVVAIGRRAWGFKTTAIWSDQVAQKGPNDFAALRGKPVTIDKAPKGPVERLYVSHTAAGSAAEPKAGDPTKAATSKRWQFKWTSPDTRPGVAAKDVTFHFAGVAANGDKLADPDPPAAPGDRTYTGSLKLKAP